MQSIFLASLLSVALITPSGSSPQDSGKTPQDLFVDAWFQETMEGDLAEALELYLKCVEEAASLDPEVAARALYRVFVIQKAQGKEEAALETLTSLKARFPKTETAMNVEKTLTSKSAPILQDAAQDAVDKAKQLLEEILITRKDVESTDAEIKKVFSVLSAEQVMEIAGDQLAMLGSKKGILAPHDTVISIILLAPDDAKVSWIERSYRLSEEECLQFLPLVNNAEPPVAFALFRRIAFRSDPRLIEGCNRLLDRLPTDQWGSSMSNLLVNPSEDALPVLERILQKCKLEPHLFLNSRSADTPTAKRLWREFPTLDVEARSKVARDVRNLRTDTPVRSDVWKVIVEDPEPQIRIEGIQGLLALDDPDSKAWATECLLKEPGPPDAFFELAKNDLGPLARVLKGRSPQVLRRIFNDALYSGGRSKKEVIELGVREYPSIFTEVVLIKPRNTSAEFYNILQDYFVSAPDLALLFELLKYASDSGDSSIVRGAITLVTRLAERKGDAWYQEPQINRFFEAMSNHRNPEIRKSSLNSKVVPTLAESTQLRLALDPNESIFTDTIRFVENSSVLRKIAESGNLRQLYSLFYRATHLKDTESIKVIYQRSMPTEPLHALSYQQLMKTDLTIAIDGLISPNDQVRELAEDWIRGLPLGKEITRPDPLSRHEERVEFYKRHIQQVQAATKEQVIRDVAEELRSQPDHVHVVDDLIKVSAVEALVGYAYSASSQVAGAAIHGLVALEEWDHIREIIHESLNVVDLPPRFDDDFVAMGRQGRLGWDRVLSWTEPDTRLRLLRDPELNLIEEHPNSIGFSILQDCIQAKDIVLIVKLCDLMKYEASKGLLSLGAYEAILDNILTWDYGNAQDTFRKLNNLAPMGTSFKQWPNFRVQQVAAVAELRKSLLGQ